MLPILLLPCCSSLVVLGEGRVTGSEMEAKAVLARSAAATGDAWNRFQKVEVSYDGEWTSIVKRIQPDLVDGEFRKSSREVYVPSKNSVEQRHEGPGGTKWVTRTPGSVDVRYEGPKPPEVDKEIRDASALVADAYTAFLFGSSWLAEKGSAFALLEAEELDGELCDRVQGRLSPGFGFSDEDRFIAWIGRDSGLLRRFQFTIEGLESTQGSDVEVRFSDHWKAKDGSIWPGSFVERVERPIHVKAHEWRMTGLNVDGRRLK